MIGKPPHEKVPFSAFLVPNHPCLQTAPRSKTEKPAKTPPNPTQRAHKALKAHTSTQRALKALKAHTSTQRAHRALKAHTSTQNPTKQPARRVPRCRRTRLLGNGWRDGMSPRTKPGDLSRLGQAAVLCRPVTRLNFRPSRFSPGVEPSNPVSS